ncbi:hypothetical protein [Caudoviricetes sp.]|nr:hypothetical protein [Caudoviricetes sp.]
MNPVKATQTQIQAIRAQAVNSITREFRTRGITLTHEQSDEIGEIGRSWLINRFLLRAVVTDVGVEFTPTP